MPWRRPRALPVNNSTGAEAGAHYKETKMQTLNNIKPDHSADHELPEFLAGMQRQMEALLTQPDAKLFTTDAAEVWPAFLAGLPTGYQQEYTCNCCRHFVERYGSLVTIDAGGTQHPVFWDTEGPEFYGAAVGAAYAKVRSAKVTGIFASDETTWGTPVTGSWTHMAAVPPKPHVHKDRAVTAYQASAAKLEEHRIVNEALAVFNLATVSQAVTLLKSDAMYRSEKVLGAAEWLKSLQEMRLNERNSKLRSNLFWRAIALAPAGFCHPRASMIGTLLEDIAAGMDFADVSKRFAAKMHPLQYQRPTAAPSTGAIAAAEKLFASMGLEASLRRRYARIEDVQALWLPTATRPEAAAGGIFGHLKPKMSEPAKMQVPAQTMTWDKFQRTVLPTADQLEFQVPDSGNFCALVTAADDSAPPILQWDFEDARNPVSWYLYNGGSMSALWGLRPGYVKVTALTLNPAQWGRPMPHQSEGVLLILDGAADSRNTSLALFPETLRTEMHGVRSVIEAYSRKGTLEGQKEASACGMLLARGSSWSAVVRVTSAGASTEYRLDRWD